MKIVCEECGSSQIQTLCWVDPNTRKIIAEGPGEVPDNWCEECEDHVDFTNKCVFLANKKNKL